MLETDVVENQWSVNYRRNVSKQILATIEEFLKDRKGP